MIHLCITTEGQSELKFVKNLLAPHLGRHHVFADGRCVLTSKDNRTSREYRGGLNQYSKAKTDITKWLKERPKPNCRFTTMFDLYALPKDFPGYLSAQNIADPYQRVRILEQALADDIRDPRLIPYIQLHEFEALLFTDIKQLDWEYLEHDHAIRQLANETHQLNPELINDKPDTTPSKRILRQIPEYDKVTAGNYILEKIGITALRRQCRHFNEWLTQLETLNNQNACD